MSPTTTLPRHPGRPLVSDPSVPIIITIDGPAGTGKSTVARRLAARLGLDFLDTGAMYRAAAAIVIDAGLPLEDEAGIVKAVAAADLHFDWSRDPPEILASNRSIAQRIRDEDVTAVVSRIARIAPLRRHMVAKQRLIGQQHPRLVTEGRDQGSVVFPDAAIKFYLDAAPAVRAARRAVQIGRAGDAARLLDEITERDRSDATRDEGPLICPSDAIRLDTSAMSLDEVVDALERESRSRASAW